MLIACSTIVLVGSVVAQLYRGVTQLTVCTDQLCWSAAQLTGTIDQFSSVIARVSIVPYKEERQATIRQLPFSITILRMR